MKNSTSSSPYVNRLALFRRPTKAARAVAFAAVLASVTSSLLAANSLSTVTTGTDLTSAATYGGTLPSATSDVIFNVGYPTAATNFTLNSSLAIGTLNDVNANAITIYNNGTSASTLTLSTAANSFAPAQSNPVGTAADLIYVGAGSSLTLQGANGGTGAGTLTLAVGAAIGNFDVGSGGTLNISATVSAAGKVIVNTGAGTINYSGASSATPSAFGKFTINGGSTVNSSGFLNASGSNVGVADSSAGTLNVTGGVFNAAVGANTFFDGNGATGAVNVSGGAFNILNAIGSTTGAASIFIGGTYNGTGGNNGNGTITVSGGTFSTSTTTGTFQLGSTSGGTGSGTINLNGGTFSTNRAFSKGSGGAGTINFNGGTLQATGAMLAIPATVTTNVRDNGAIIDSNGFSDNILANLVASTLSGDSGTGGLTVKNSGTTGVLTLLGTNTYAGTTTINSTATLQIGNLGTTGTLGNGAGGVTDNGILILSRSNAYTVTNSISGTGALQNAGSGTTTLTGTNTYSGGTAVNTGTLEATGTASLPGYATSGKITVANGGTLALAVGGSGQFTSGNVDSVLASATFASGSALGLDTTGGNFAYASNISGSEGLIKLGSNTLTLTGTNTYTGANNLAAGTLNLGSAQALGGGGTVASVGIISFTGGTLQYSAANQTDYSSRFSSSGNQALNIDTNGQTVTFGTLLASSGGTLTKLGAGTLILGSSSSTYSGITTISAGTLQLGSGSTTGSVGTGAIVNNSALTLNHSTAWTLANGISGSGTLTQNGAGAVTLSANNTYTGATQVNVGEINADGAGILPLSTSAVTVANGANVTVGDHAGGTLQTMTNNFTLSGAGISVSAPSTSATLAAGALAFYNSGGFALSGSFNLASTSVIYDNPVTQSGNITFSGVISGAGGLVLAGANSSTTGSPVTNLALSSANTYGTTTATTQFTNNGNGPMTVTLSAVNDVLPTNTVLTLGGVPNGQGGSYNGNVTLSLNGINQTVAGLATGTTSGVYRIIGNNSTTVSTLTVNNTANYTYSGFIGTTGFNTVALTKSGSGSLTLTAANTYTGATSVNAGTLLVSGSINGSTSVSVAATGTLTLSNTAAAVLADAGTLSLVSGATLNLNAASGTSESISNLVLDTTTEPAGTYTAAQLTALDGSINFSSLNGETLTVVPEPSTYLGGLLLVAAFGWSVRSRFARRSA